MSQVLLGFLPWILFWCLSAFNLWQLAILGALATSVGLVGYRFLRRRDVKAMEAVTAGFFAVHFIVTIVVGSPIFIVYGPIFNNLTLAAMAWGTLLAGSPFTYQYARDEWPREYWSSPTFRRTNEIITTAWGAIFSLNVGLGVLSLWLPGSALLLNAVLANLLVGVGIAFSKVFPSRAAARSAAKSIAARDPWPSPTFDQARPASANEHDVIVIGAGLGGLTAAALLAQRGRKVIVFEQHFLAGGFCTAWERGVRRGAERLRYVFDAGIHDLSGLGERGGTRNLLRQLHIEDRLEWRRMDHEYFTADVSLKVPREAYEFANQLAQHFPAERDNLTAFFTEMEAVYRERYADIEKTGGVPTEPRTVQDHLDYPRQHPHVFRWMNASFGAMLDHYFQDPGLKHFLSVLTGYLSDDPKTLSAVSMSSIFSYYFDGGYYAVGSSQRLADALVDVIEQHGGVIWLRTAVSRILVREGRAIGVELANGETHTAKAIISNSDVKRTFLQMVGREHLPADFARQVEALTPSNSAFEVFLGINFVPEVAPVTIVKKAVGHRFGVMIPSKVDPSLAPPGHASLVLMTLISQPEAATWDRKAPDYAARKRAMGDALIDAAEEVIPGLRAGIIYRQDGSPATMARYAWTTDGAIYGVKGDKLPTKSPIERLYLAGAGAVPGAGGEGAIISGTLAADSVFAAAHQPNPNTVPHVDQPSLARRAGAFEKAPQM